jgi:hypothetical protein
MRHTHTLGKGVSSTREWPHQQYPVEEILDWKHFCRPEDDAGAQCYIFRRSRGA